MTPAERARQFADDLVALGCTPPADIDALAAFLVHDDARLERIITRHLQANLARRNQAIINGRKAS